MTPGFWSCWHELLWSKLPPSGSPPCLRCHCHPQSPLNVETKVTPTSSLTHIRNVERLALNKEKTDRTENEKEGHLCRRNHHAGIIKVVSEQRNGHVLVLHTTCVTWIIIEQGMHARRVWRDWQLPAGIAMRTWAVKETQGLHRRRCQVGGCKSTNCQVTPWD